MKSNNNHILFKNFLTMYKSALKTQGMNTAEVTRNIGKSSSYLYNFLKNYKHRKYISYDKLVQIGSGLGYNNYQIINWVKSMDSIKTIDDDYKAKQQKHRQLVHPIHEQNGISHKEMHQRMHYKQHKIKEAKIRKARAKQRHEHNYRYHQIGHIINILHKLTTKNLDDAEAQVFGILLKQPKPDNK